MKKKIPILVFSGVLLIIFLTQSACNHSPKELVFEQNEQIYVIDKENSGVTIFTDEGVLIYSIGSPSAGTGAPVNAPPSEVDLVNIQNIILILVFNNKGNISGLIWNDLNGNRFISAGEQGVQNVRVFIDTNGNKAYDSGEQSALSDINGLYTIPGIKAGTTTISIDTSTLPGGYGFTTTNPITINLADNQTAYDIDFGIQDQSGKISGIIWDQTDNIPIPGVLVYLDQNADSEHTIGEPYNATDASGRYLIPNLPGGSYVFNVDNDTLNIKYHRTPVAGSNPTQIHLAPSDSLNVNLNYAHIATISGFIRDTSGNAWANIVVFIDLNGNGVYDDGEPITKTNMYGKYTFDNLTPGSYTVTILPDQLPAGYDVLVTPGSITIGGRYNSANFLTQPQPLSITGYVWDDENKNRAREPGEKGLAGVTVFLDINNNGSLEPADLTTLTDTTGAYSFINLDHGQYTIQADDSLLKNEYIATTTNPVSRIIQPGETFDRAKFGYQSKLAPEHTLQYPTRLSWGASDKLYVSDNISNSVFIYDSSLNVQGELKNLAKPLAVITDGAGNIYVGNKGRKNVEVYDSFGNLIRTIGDGQIETPNDLAFDRNSNIYILDSSKDNIVVFDQTGNPTGTTIGNSSLFDYAVSIAINYRDDGSGTETGELYVADQPNCAIHVFSLSGTYIKSVGRCGSLYTTNWDGKFSGLVAVVIDQSGDIHGLDNNLNVVQVFEPQNGTFLRSYNAYSVDNEFFLNLQTDLSIHPADNRVIMTNAATKNVELIHTVP